MQYLNKEHILELTNKLREEEINYSHLFDDLLDHVCCDVEKYMQQGLCFIDAKNQVYKEIGLNGLKEIQEATILYVKFNLLLMKKLMKVMGLIGTPMLITGLLFKFMHWPGASMLFALGLVLLLIGFFPPALLSVRKELKVPLLSKDFLIYLVGFLVITETSIALLFRMMHWPGTSILILISTVSMLFVFFPMLFYRIIKSSAHKTVNISLVLFATLFFGVLAIQTYNAKTSVYNVAENAHLENELFVYKKALTELESECPVDYQKLIASKKQVEETIKAYQLIILNGEVDIYQTASKFLSSSDMHAYYDNGFSTLKEALQIFHAEALLLTPNNNFQKQIITQKLLTDPISVDVYGQIPWHKRMFEGAGGDLYIYTTLNKILCNIYEVEYMLLINQPQRSS